MYLSIASFSNAIFFSCSSWHGFNWNSASHAPTAIAELSFLFLCWSRLYDYWLAHAQGAVLISGHPVRFLFNFAARCYCKMWRVLQQFCFSVRLTYSCAVSKRLSIWSTCFHYCVVVFSYRTETLGQCTPPPRHVCRGCLSWWRNDVIVATAMPASAFPALQRRAAQSVDTTFRISQ